jgi:hypothetical protein
MENNINQQIYNNCRNSTNWIDFYNSINTSSSNFLDSDNESLESLDSDDEEQNFINYVLPNQPNIPIVNNPNNILDNVINQLQLEHIRRPIIIGNNRNISIEHSLIQIESLNRNMMNRNVNSNNRSIYNNLSFQNAIDESFDISNNTETENTVSVRHHNDKISKMEKIKNDEDIDCIICMEKIEKNKTVYKIDCNHKFHKHCLSNWLKQKFECPVCRHNI